jgi:hypothetical protein
MLPQVLELMKKLTVPYDGSVSIAGFSREQLVVILALQC